MDQPVLLSFPSIAAKGTVCFDAGGSTSGGKVQTTGLLVSLVDELDSELMRIELTAAVNHMPCLGLCGGGIWGCCVCHCADGGMDFGGWPVGGRRGSGIIKWLIGWCLAREDSRVSYPIAQGCCKISRREEHEASDFEQALGIPPPAQLSHRI